jgi:tetratricopeptide (TPR) repeat protein
MLGMISFNLWHPRFLGVQEDVFQLQRQRSDSRPSSAIFLAFNRLSQGKLRAALEGLDDPLLPPLSSIGIAYYSLSVGLPIPVERLDRELTVAMAESLGAEGRDYLAMIYVGAFAADRARWPEHEKAVVWLRDDAQRALASGDSAKARFLGGEALALDGYRQWKEGNPGDAVRTLETAQRQATGNGPESFVNSMLRFWLGKLLLETGRSQEAERYFRSLQPDPIASYELGEIYEDLGEFAKARESYELFAIGWQDADPELQPRVVEARAAIQRLTSAIKE